MPEVQMVFAEALRQGDALLIDTISFIFYYRDIPIIQERDTSLVLTTNMRPKQIMSVIEDCK
ncbi:MAG: hypothetical protein EAX81_07600 [Candidatus Thorarchaeota archaeon]|nr:hypothetical protein [Candidatus Thorarchaeota archaeon]